MALRQERVAQRLAELRERHALSQERAAQKVGITHRQWQRWENGQSMPRPGNLGEVALAFGVPVSTFYDDDEQVDQSQLDRIEEKLDLLLSLFRPDEQSPRPKRPRRQSRIVDPGLGSSIKPTC
jgi:transcriptional regulator with XRE-family HTH domain